MHEGASTDSRISILYLYGPDSTVIESAKFYFVVSFLKLSKAKQIIDELDKARKLANKQTTKSQVDNNEISQNPCAENLFSCASLVSSLYRSYPASSRPGNGIILDTNHLS